MGRYLVSVAFLCCFALGLNAIQDGKNLVASATPEATEAGVSIFEKGGNAIDASIAVAFTLGVTEPAMSGLGGRTMMLISIPNETPIAIGGHSRTPFFVEPDITRDNLKFHKQVSIPSQVKVLYTAWKKYGSGKLRWEELLEPAIGFAENGFIVGKHRHHVYKRWETRIKESPYHNGEVLINGDIPAIGDVIKQPTLAETLKRLAKHGGDDFYKGDIAKQIAQDFQSHGGWITYEDLANFPEPEIFEPLHITYRGYDVYSFVPPSGGWQVLQVLNLLEQSSPDAVDENDQQRKNLVINALNLSHNNRLEQAITDYTNYEAQVNDKISKSFAKALLEANNQPNSPIQENDNQEGETTHFSVVDEKGLAVSVTSSVGAYFGSLTSTKNLGFFYNSYVKSLLGFGLGKKLEPNTIIPSSMSPSLVRKDGKNVLVIGTPGSKRIVSTIAQLIQLWVDGNNSITEIIGYPRIHAIQNKVYLEDENLDSEWLQQLREQGYKITFPDYDLTIDGKNAYFGGVHAIEFRNGQWSAAADPRRDGNTN